MDVSVIIATRNRANALEYYALSSLSKKSIPTQELLVIDSSDNDYSRMICETRKESLRSSLVWIRAKRAGSASQRNLGATLAKGGILFFIDDDSELEADAIKVIMESFADPSIAGVGLPIRNFQKTGMPKANILIRILYYESLWPKRRTINAATVNSIGAMDWAGPADWLSGCSMAVRRDAFFNAGGFDEGLETFGGYALGEDIELSHRLKLSGGSLMIADSSGMYHHSVLGGRPDSDNAISLLLYNRYRIWRSLRSASIMAGKKSRFSVLAIFSYLLMLTCFSVLRSVVNMRAGPARGVKNALEADHEAGT